MNEIQKEKIIQFRKLGISYSKIANSQGISINTIKSLCRRNNLGSNSITTNEDSKINKIFCTECGRELKQVASKKPLRFCNDKCRIKWWNAHPELVNKKAIYSFTYINCEEPFTAYEFQKKVLLPLLLYLPPIWR